MPNQPISNKTAAGLTKFLMIIGVVVLAMWGYVLYQSYQGRVDLVRAERGGCVRTEKNGIANAKGWRAAETARLEAFMKTSHLTEVQAHKILFQKRKPDDPPDLVAAWKYDRIANDLEVRSSIDCTKAFPKASLLP
jgi:hypothetical protein